MSSTCIVPSRVTLIVSDHCRLGVASPDPRAGWMRSMSVPTDPKGSFLSDLAGIEDKIARSSGADSAPGEPSDPREKRYRHLVENSLGLICTHDLEGVVLSVN